MLEFLTRVDSVLGVVGEEQQRLNSVSRSLTYGYSRHSITSFTSCAVVISGLGSEGLLEQTEPNKKSGLRDVSLCANAYVRKSHARRTATDQGLHFC